MNFSYAQTMCDPSYLLPLAVEAEKAGYHSMVVPDNLGYAGPSTARYPYTEDGKMVSRLVDSPVAIHAF